MIYSALTQHSPANICQRLYFKMAVPRKPRADLLSWNRRSYSSGSIPVSIIVLCFASDCFASAFITIDRDDFQPAIWRQSHQNHRSFESCNCSPSAIALQNIPLSQNIERDSRSIYAFSMLKHVFKVAKRHVALCHSENGMLRKSESRARIFHSFLFEVSCTIISDELASWPKFISCSIVDCPCKPFSKTSHHPL